MFRPAAVVLLALFVAGCSRSDVQRVDGGGATFIEPLMLKWQRATKPRPASKSITPAPARQRRSTVDPRIHFVWLHRCADDRRSAKIGGGNGRRNRSTFPLALGGVVPIYYLAAVPADRPLRFSGPVLADIFLGAIGRWNDPLLGANPGIILPDQPINIVSRSTRAGRPPCSPNISRRCDPRHGRPRTWAKGWTCRSPPASAAGQPGRGGRGCPVGRGHRLRRIVLREIHERRRLGCRGPKSGGAIRCRQPGKRRGRGGRRRSPNRFMFFHRRCAGAGCLSDQRHELGRLPLPAPGRPGSRADGFPSMGHGSRPGPAVHYSARLCAVAGPRCRRGSAPSWIRSNLNKKGFMPELTQAPTRPVSTLPGRAFGDTVFGSVCRASAWSVIVIAVSLTVVLAIQSWPFFRAVGFEFLRIVPWNPGAPTRAMAGWPSSTARSPRPPSPC